MNMKRIFSIFAAALMLLTLFGAVAGPSQAKNALQGEEPPASQQAPTPWQGGGSESDPYLIHDAFELSLLSQLVNSGKGFSGEYFALAADIDLSGEPFAPIGSTSEHPFEGCFDGRGFIIRSLSVAIDGDFAGLFGCSIGELKNIVLEAASVSGRNLVGGIVGSGSAAHCAVSGEISGSNDVGGIVGDGDAFDCFSDCSVSGAMRIGGLVGTGTVFGGESRASVKGEGFVSERVGLGTEGSYDEESGELDTGAGRAKSSVASFIRFALSHIDRTSVPTNARLFVPTEQSGTSPWEYLYGSVRAKTSQATLNNYFANNYTKYMVRSQFDHITDDWSRDTYATDCQGLLDAYMTYEEGVQTDINVHMNYTYWCTDKGRISEIDRPWQIGEAVFVQSRRTLRYGHIGWICGFDEDNMPLVVEARGVSFGVVVTRMEERNWTHRGLMTVKFNYDAAFPNIENAITKFPEPNDALIFENVHEEAPFGEVPSREVWDGSIASSFAGGSGTSGDPYRISTPSQLAYLARSVNYGNSYNGKYFSLTSDIYLNSTDNWSSWDRMNGPANSWDTIGRFTNSSTIRPFRGNFNGNGHTIYGLYYSTSSVCFYGLFGFVECESGTRTIENVNVARSFIDSVNSVGGIAGYTKGNVEIKNCSFAGKIDAELWVGGILGYADVRSDGSDERASIERCRNLGPIKGDSDVGGIVGRAYTNTVISRCSNTGAVRGFDAIGGILGGSIRSRTMYCYNDAEVRGALYVGGVVGQSFKLGGHGSTAIEASYNSRPVRGRTAVGGILGGDSHHVNGAEYGYTGIGICFNTGTVTGHELTGGIAGNFERGHIRQVYNIGTVTARRTGGGITGRIPSSGVTVNEGAFYLDTCYDGTSSVGFSMTDYALLSSGNYYGFSFPEYWTIWKASDGGESIDNPDYPFAEIAYLSYASENIPDMPTPPPTPAPSAPPLPGSPNGDVNGDGVVDSSDSILALRFALGLLSEIDFENADMTGDGAITSADAIAILRVAMGVWS